MSPNPEDLYDVTIHCLVVNDQILMDVMEKLSRVAAGLAMDGIPISIGISRLEAAEDEEHEGAEDRD